MGAKGPAMQGAKVQLLCFQEPSVAPQAVPAPSAPKTRPRRKHRTREQVQRHQTSELAKQETMDYQQEIICLVVLAGD